MFSILPTKERVVVVFQPFRKKAFITGRIRPKYAHLVAYDVHSQTLEVQAVYSSAAYLDKKRVDFWYSAYSSES
jgi:hypothetical protein